jgi:hypothetical protein
MSFLSFIIAALISIHFFFLFFALLGICFSHDDFHYRKNLVQVSDKLTCVNCSLFTKCFSSRAPEHFFHVFHSFLSFHNQQFSFYVQFIVAEKLEKLKNCSVFHLFAVTLISIFIRDFTQQYKIASLSVFFHLTLYFKTIKSYSFNINNFLFSLFLCSLLFFFVLYIIATEKFVCIVYRQSLED